jgi:hypothetical protein
LLQEKFFAEFTPALAGVQNGSARFFRLAHPYFSRDLMLTGNAILLNGVLQATNRRLRLAAGKHHGVLRQALQC